MSAADEPAARFGPGIPVATPDFPRSVAVLDLNADGRIDVAVSVENVGVVVYHNDAAGALREAQRVPVDFTVLQGPRTLRAGDLDGDGAPDLVFVRRDAGAVTYSIFLLFNLGDGTFTPPQFVDEYRACATGKTDGLLRGSDFIALADVDGDGALDILAPASLDLRIYFNDGAGRFAAPLSGPVADACVSIVTADIDRDGDVDLLMTDRAFRDSGVIAEINDGRGRFTQTPLFDLPFGEFGVAPLDLDADGDLDFAVSGFQPDTFATIRNDDAAFFATNSIPLPSLPDRILSADLNGDGAADLAVGTIDNVAVLMGRGDGTLTAPVRFGDASRDLRLADANGDGRPDLVYLRDADFVILPNVTQPACPGDLDGDAATDLNDLARLLSHFGVAGGALPNLGDVDADHDVDLDDLSILLANFGTACG